MKKLLKAILIFLLMMQSCSKEAWLSGSLKLSKTEDWSSKIYLVLPEKFSNAAQSFVGQILDSAAVSQDGSFRFTEALPIKDSTLLFLVVQQKGERFANRLMNENPATDNYFPLVYEPGTSLRVDAEMANFQSSFSIANPSPSNAAMLKLRDLRLEAFKHHFETENGLDESDEGLLEREKNLKAYQGKLIDFADTTEHLLPALMALRWASPEGNYERIAERLYAQSKKWHQIHPRHPWVNQLESLADRDKLPVLLGDTLPDLLLPMQTGEHLFLSEIGKGKELLLLDIWASWCAPCRVENRNVLVPLWENYNNRGFQIIAYGLESSKSAWENAIERDGAYRWLHASHLEGDQNPVMDSLRLRTIPANFLLDKEGKVLAKNLHGQDLIRFVQDYLVNR
ncbi:TlpA family protein disulfide reductase [Flagellimonas sp.]|uniref:TlpA family protein disulfide reductase n=1 Tax=Flagellimonas sp. TaxID=2058762 RepID=UPI003BA8A9F6